MTESETTTTNDNDDDDDDDKDDDDDDDDNDYDDNDDDDDGDDGSHSRQAESARMPSPTAPPPSYLVVLLLLLDQQPVGKCTKFYHIEHSRCYNPTPTAFLPSVRSAASTPQQCPQPVGDKMLWTSFKLLNQSSHSARKEKRQESTLRRQLPTGKCFRGHSLTICYGGFTIAHAHAHALILILI
ncbi:hypothetical protein ACLKA6_009952 [Drosophila palustris]